MTESFQFSVVRFQLSARSCRGEWKLNVINLEILPGMGKIELSAGSPGWGTRGKHKLVTLHLYLDCIAGNGDYIAAGVDGYAALRAVGCP